MTRRRRKVKFFAEMYESEKEKWTEEKTKADGEIKKLQNELKTKEANLAKLESEVDDKKKKELEASITKLQFQLAFLTAELEAIIREIFNEDVRGKDLKERLKYLQEELDFKLEVLNKELESEMARTKMDISSMDVRIKGEYINRLKVEVDILRGTYDKFMKDTWEQLEAEYKERLAKLELELTLLLNQQSSLEDAGAIK